MYKIGVTGGIGSGKSTVCKIFESLGIPVFRADEESRRLLDEDEEVKKSVAALFKEPVFINNKPDRKKIASLVFNNHDKLKELNAIIHPKVRAAVAAWANKQHTDWVIEEAAILFESGAYKNLDAIIVVSAPESLRIKRVMARDGITEASVKERMKNQLTEEERRKRADFIVENDDTQLLIPQAIEIMKKVSLKIKN
ncbi:MAG TPA: dephospho-CoA kinase [Bacteroidia bacterium]|jgi:dephospho-CoA kinase|nr:dephospho-CoA kinase [Bacteroidia bacterium]